MKGRHHIRPTLVTAPPLLFLVVILLSSCSVGHYLSAYFNTYFNASRLFAEAEEEIRAQQTPQGTDTTYLPPYKIQAGTKTKLTSVVEKCSKILQYDSESSLVDDALLMIGKSYYYQNELQRAERKFAELINGYPESGLVAEAEVLLAETYYRLNEKEKAMEAALVIADSTGGDNEGASARAFLLIGRLEYEKQNYQEARRSYRFAAEYGETDEQRVIAYMKVAEMSVRLDDLDAALDAYEDAEDESSVYVREFHARMGQIEILTRQEKYGRALDLLDDIRVNANFSEFFPEVDLAIANTLKAEGLADEAVEQYYYVDSTYQRTPSSARSHLALGRIYETERGQYDSALAVYTRGRNQSPQDPATQIMARRADNLRQYKNYSTEIARLESLKVEVLRRENDPVAAVEMLPDSSGDSISVVPPPPPLPGLDSLNAGLARNMADLGGLFYIGMGVEDSARFWYETVLERYPESPYSPRALYTLAQIEEAQKGQTPRVDSLYTAIIDLYPSSPFAAESRRLLGFEVEESLEDPGVALYAAGEEALDSQDTEEALRIFRQVVDRYPDSESAPKAQFAIAWIYEQVMSRPDSAVKNFKKLVHQYPATPYATVAFTRLNNLPPEEVRKLEQPEPIPAISDSAGIGMILPDGNGIEEEGGMVPGGADSLEVTPPVEEEMLQSDPDSLAPPIPGPEDLEDE